MVKPSLTICANSEFWRQAPAEGCTWPDPAARSYPGKSDLHLEAAEEVRLMGALAKNVVREVPAQAAIELFETLLAGYGKADLQIRLWDGSTCGGGQPRCTLVI